ncbi:acyl-CoA carboxylase subunit beta [Chloroflexota bacterium]
MDAEMKKSIEEYNAKRALFLGGGGSKAVKRQHDAGKLTARERVEKLADPGSFVEYDLFINRHSSDFGMGDVEAPTEGFITGICTIDQRPVAVCAQDFTVLGGSVGNWGSKKMMKIANLALSLRIPLVMVNDSAGARPQEQHEVMEEGYGPLFNFHTLASGVIPQVTLVMGSVAGGPCYAPALTDFIFMVKDTSAMFIGGPPVVKAVTGEEITEQDLGGAKIHTTVNGVADLAFKNDEECLQATKDLLSYLPLHNTDNPERQDTGDDPLRTDDSLAEIVPGNPIQSYDIHRIIEKVFDNGTFLEIKPTYAPNLVTAFARLNGLSVGILANQPQSMGGALCAKSSWKGARFVRFCDAFNIPIIHLVDTPGYLVGSQSEKEGIIRHGAKLLFAESEATVPVITLVLRKGYAGATGAMGSRAMRVADYAIAWPIAKFSIMGIDAGMSVLKRTSKMKKGLAETENPEALLQSWEEEYEKKYLDLYAVAPVRHVDEIIDPSQTRPTIIRALELLRTKKKEIPWKKHGNIPL